MANRITLNETSYHGAGAIQEIALERLKNRGFHKALVCTGPGSLQARNHRKGNQSAGGMQAWHTRFSVTLSPIRPLIT